MSAPRFSVVIPTRERAGTLASTLATCTNQEFEDYEVVVCDNCSSPATRHVVEGCRSPRVRYVRADRPLAMSANWELALSHARGEYVLFLGDDDGLMPYALHELDALLTRLRCPVLRWDWVFYTYPSLPQPEDANYLVIPLSRELQWVDARGVLSQVARFEGGYSGLPMIYLNAVIHQDLIRQARARTGRVFNNRIPDVYSGVVFAYLAGKYPTVSVPMTVAALSGKSNGYALLAGDGRDPIVAEFDELNVRSGYLPHPQIPNLRLLQAQVADSFQFAREAFFPDDEALRLDRRLVAESCARGLWTTDESGRQKAFRLIRDGLADEAEMLAWFDALVSQGLPVASRPRLRAPQLGVSNDRLHLNADRHGIEDVAGAAAFSAQLLGYRAGQIAYDCPSGTTTWSQLVRCQQELDRRRDVIHQLLARVNELATELQSTRGLCRRLLGRLLTRAWSLARGGGRAAA